MRALSDRDAGFAYAVSGMVTWGMVPVLAHRWAGAMDPLLFGGLSTLAGGFPLLALLARRGAHRDLIAPRFARSWLGIGFFGVCSTLFLFYGTTLTSGLNTGLLLQLEPLYSVLLAGLFLGEAIRAPQLGATLAMVAGAAVVLFHGGKGLNRGDLLIAVTPCFQQLSHVITKRIIHRVADTNAVPTARLLYSGAVVTALALAWHPESARQLAVWRNWQAILAFGLILRALDCFLWYQAIQRISLSLASATIPLSVAVSFMGSTLILGERVEPRHIAGLTLILAGLAWLSWIHVQGGPDPMTEEPF